MNLLSNEVLVGKTLEQSMMEVLEEEELASLQRLGLGWLLGFGLLGLNIWLIFWWFLIWFWVVTNCPTCMSCELGNPFIIPNRWYHNRTPLFPSCSKLFTRFWHLPNKICSRSHEILFKMVSLFWEKPQPLDCLEAPGRFREAPQRRASGGGPYVERKPRRCLALVSWNRGRNSMVLKAHDVWSILKSILSEWRHLKHHTLAARNTTDQETFKTPSQDSQTLSQEAPKKPPNWLQMNIPKNNSKARSALKTLQKLRISKTNAWREEFHRISQVRKTPNWKKNIRGKDTIKTQHSIKKNKRKKTNEKKKNNTSSPPRFATARCNAWKLPRSAARTRSSAGWRSRRTAVFRSGVCWGWFFGVFFKAVALKRWFTLLKKKKWPLKGRTCNKQIQQVSSFLSFCLVFLKDFSQEFLVVSTPQRPSWSGCEARARSLHDAQGEFFFWLLCFSWNMIVSLFISLL